MKNTKINELNRDLVNCVNYYLAEGVEISTVVICLDKCLAEAKLLEQEIIQKERKEAEMATFQKHLADQEKLATETENDDTNLAVGEIDTCVSSMESLEADGNSEDTVQTDLNSHYE